MDRNPKVWCALHATEMVKTNEELDDDGTQLLVKQYWKGACGCLQEITLAIPRDERPN